MPAAADAVFTADFPAASADGVRRADVVLVGAGIMGATLGTLLKQLQPDLSIRVLERLDKVALESSAADNNAGTGHGANCELNYTPLQADGSVSVAKAIAINTAFERSLEFWSSLVAQGVLPDPRTFITPVPHISFVRGAADVAYLKQRHSQLGKLPAFAAMAFSEDPAVLASWMPLVMAGRDPAEPVAATRLIRGTDVDFGRLSEALFKALSCAPGVALCLGHQLEGLRQRPDGSWDLQVRRRRDGVLLPMAARFVFLGAGGGTLPLLQKSGIAAAKGYGGFPVSGQWLVCTNPVLVALHRAKVYGKAALGAPPMSVPHLDARCIDDQPSLLFGPFAGFSSRFLKQGSLLDLPRSIRPDNLGAMLSVGIRHADLLRYLIGQLAQSDGDRHRTLRTFMPTADPADWRLETAGQRVQIIKTLPGQGGQLQLGTEVVTAADGSLAALLGASPGASTAVVAMLELLQCCWASAMASAPWQQRLRQLMPSHGIDLDRDAEALARSRSRSDQLLRLR